MRFYSGIFFFSIILIAVFCFSGCGSDFLKKEELDQIKFRDRSINSIVFYNKLFLVIDEKNLEVSTHFILKIGKNHTNLPQYLHVFDGSMLKLMDFQAKITKPDGSTRTFSKSDLYIHNLSNSRTITDSYVKILPIDKYISTGDMIEMIYKHKTDLAPLGMDFSLSETDHYAENISCTIQLPNDLFLKYKVINDTITPVIKRGENYTSYSFKWREYTKVENKINPFATLNNAPGIIASFDFVNKNVGENNWKKFGDWYLNLISPKIINSDIVKQKALEITSEYSKDKEKMDAILRFCQKNIRYEQVYMTKGEIIPNNPETILKNRYGDCKDYSLLIYSLAKSVGLTPHLALCYRGRGTEFYPDIPANQFNHMIVNFHYDKIDYWYDGTNRTGIPGITSKDLINQNALILEKENSHISTIGESENNLLLIKGKLKPEKNDLSGELNLSFNEQFAIEYFFAESYLSKKDMEILLLKIIKETLNQSIIINKINWKSHENAFEVNLNCKIPNGLLSLNNSYYTSINRLFPLIINADSSDLNPRSLFYFPDYNKVSLDILLEGLSSPDNGTDKSSSFHIGYSISLPAGPFKGDNKKNFIEKFTKTYFECNQKTKLIRN